MIVQCWGVRGTIPSPGLTTQRYGGNTPCIAIEFGTGCMLVLDAGTGIRRLGLQLASTSFDDIIIGLTHLHWDHIQGFPFFSPIFQGDRTIHLLPCPVAPEEWSLLNLLDGRYHPLHGDQLPARFILDRDATIDRLRKDGVLLTRIATNHPGGACGYRIEHKGQVVVYIPDNELEPPGTETTSRTALVEFCRDADLLLHDAQYLDADMPHRHGWGHSLVRQTCALGVDANVRTLLLFHHDPERSDDAIDEIERYADDYMASRGSTTACYAAVEGMRIELRGPGEIPLVAHSPGM